MELESNLLRLHQLTQQHDLDVDIDAYLPPPPDSSLPTPAPLHPYPQPQEHDSDQEEGVPSVRRGKSLKRRLGVGAGVDQATSPVGELLLGGEGQVERRDNQTMTSRKLHQGGTTELDVCGRERGMDGWPDVSLPCCHFCVFSLCARAVRPTEQ